MKTDIRDMERIDPQDVRALNFIRDSSDSYVFRNHTRQGLRSHILEVLRKKDLDLETTGFFQEGIRIFPAATPLKMLRIFRRKFADLSTALDEIRRFQRVRHFLTPSHLALSNEFIVDYDTGKDRQILLCGLQEYVFGAELDPWHPDPVRYMMDQFEFVTGMDIGNNRARKAWEVTVKSDIENFVARVKKLIGMEGLIPDLAGVRNILVGRKGQVKLVDINNISDVHVSDEIHLDDLGYPVCDKSIEVLHRLETRVLGKEVQADALYATFLKEARLNRVRTLVDSFNEYSCASGFCGE